MSVRSLIRGSITGMALGLAGLLSPGAAAAGPGPQGVVRQFCQADGNGQRVTTPGWTGIAPLVTWAYEPAWDTVVLITGYTVDAPQPAEENVLAVPVRYAVVAQLSPLGLNGEAHVESVIYRIAADEQGLWHILGPPPLPHLFVNRVDIEAMRRSLSDGGVNFLANSVFVWQMYQSAGWNVPFESTNDLLSGATYHPVDSAKAGDLVVYLRDGTPYHVGLLEAKNQIVSSTLNAGIMRTTVDAFAGEVRYLRLGRLPAAPSAAPLVIRPAPTAPKPRPSPGAQAGKKKKTPTPPSKNKHPAKPSGHTRVQTKPKNAAARPRPTPTVRKASR
jgi:hypothetical protein